MKYKCDVNLLPPDAGPVPANRLEAQRLARVTSGGGAYNQDIVVRGASGRLYKIGTGAVTSWDHAPEAFVCEYLKPGESITLTAL